jgi:hypothetical protein
VIYNITHIKRTNLKNAILANANSLMLKKNKEIKRNNLVKLSNNANIVINSDIAKCNTCSLLEI